MGHVPWSDPPPLDVSGKQVSALESIWEFEIPEYQFTGGVIEIVIWEMPINGMTQAPDASRYQQGLNCFLKGIEQNIMVDLMPETVYQSNNYPKKSSDAISVT
jgi:hypothetical protein